MEKMFNVPVELFQLEKLVLEKNKTCKVWYTIADDRGDKSETFKGFLNPDYQCVLSMQEKLNELKPYLISLRHIKDSESEKLSVKGLVWKGSGDSEAFQILGTNKSDSEKNMACDSAVEHCGAEKYTFENEIRDIIIELEEFAHGYIFEGRKAEITMGLTPIQGDEENNDADKSEEQTED